MSYRPVCAEAQNYPWRMTQELLCDRCGEGFSSIKPVPRFCCLECATEFNKEDMAARARTRNADPEFRERLISARKAAGYPDSNREEAVALRKMRTAVKNSLHRCLRLDESAGMASLEYNHHSLKTHLESLFESGMSWSNYGLWEIDHIFPISKFPPGTPLKTINALNNLQPLWKAANRKKHAHVQL
jgi:hypothetical protein